MVHCQCGALHVGYNLSLVPILQPSHLLDESSCDFTSQWMRSIVTWDLSTASAIRQAMPLVPHGSRYSRAEKTGLLAAVRWKPR